MEEERRPFLHGDSINGDGGYADPPFSPNRKKISKENPLSAFLYDSDIKLDTQYVTDVVTTKPPNSSSKKLAKGVAAALLAVGVPIGSWIYFGVKTVLIDKGNVGLVLNNGEPELLAPGWHLLLSGFRSFVEQVPVTREHITHGTINVVTINEGYIGMAYDRGQPILLPPGMHQWNSDTMKFQGSYDLSQEVVKVGPYTYLLVHDGNVAITHNNGKLDIRQAGHHLLKHERHLFYGNLMITDQFDELNDLDLITRDNVPVNVDCTVHYKIVDAYTTALEAGKMAQVKQLVMREARAAMASSVLQSTVSDMELLTEVNSPTIQSNVKGGDLIGDSKSPVSPLEVSKSKSEAEYKGRQPNDKKALFMFRAQESLKNIGVRLFKIAIRKIKILDHDINRKLAQQASIRVTRLESLDTADVQSQTLNIEAQAQAEALITAAKAEAQKVRILADARLYEAEKIKEAAEIYGSSSAALLLAELQSVGDIVAKTKTNTIFVGGGSGGGIVNALLANPAVYKDAQ